MDKVEKALQKLTDKERKRLKEIFKKLQSGNLDGVDIKKLKGRENIFRVKKGPLRVIYRADKGLFFILTVEKRNDNTYK